MDSQEGDSEKNDSFQDDEDEKEMTEPEIGAQEIEIETERVDSPDEIHPDFKNSKVTIVPPLRPLTIAPKPPTTKVPISLKPAAVSGQQLFLVQGGSPGQAIKFLSPQGQSISLANFAKPLAFKPAVKTVAVSGTQGTGVSVVQPKQIMVRKISSNVQGQKIASVVDGKSTGILLTQKADGGQTVKLATNQGGSTIISSPSKTITLAQAQQMGLLTGAKIVTQPVTKQAIFMNKTQNKPVKIMPQVSKFPTKILPAPQITTSGKGTQRIILKQAGGSATLLPNQIIQVGGAQGLATGQLHPISIPGKGIQYIKFVTASTSNDTSTSSSQGTITTAKLSSAAGTTGSKLIAIATSNNTTKVAGVLTEVKNIGATANIAPKTAKVVTASAIRSSDIGSVSNPPTQLLMFPTSYIRASANSKVPIPAKPTLPKNTSSVISDSAASGASPIETNSLESNGMRPRKPCNCTKSQCLKLYCDCFANGEFCYMCNCMNCFNNLENEEHRQLAIKSCLERNPNAFRPKIGKSKDTGTDTQVRKHTKGCNCKRSGCLKNYCECYEAKIACSSNCKCFGCRNIESSIEKKGLQVQTSPTHPIHNIPPNVPKINPPRNILQIRPRRHSSSKHAFSLITDDVIEITTQCLLTMSDNAETNCQNEEALKQQIIVEFGRCLQEIINHSTNRQTTTTNSSV
ncbi:protein lin-54 homolog isoform X2 [Agrilus planipennis]|nr:protein lin-54 homolog isoform X2 [Agrilus planipennis]